MHLIDHNCDHDYYFGLPKEKGEWDAFQLVGLSRKPSYLRPNHNFLIMTLLVVYNVPSLSMEHFQAIAFPNKHNEVNGMTNASEGGSKNKASAIPVGYHTVTPWIIVKGA